MAADIFNNDVSLRALVDMANASGVNYRPNSIFNSAIASTAAIAVTKLQHLHKIGTNFALAIGGTVASREEIVFIASGAATIRAFKATCNACGSTGDSDFDLKVNGSTVLSGAVNIDNADTDGAVESGSISSAALVAGDIVSIALTRNSSHDGTGPFAWVEIDEAAN